MNPDIPIDASVDTELLNLTSIQTMKDGPSLLVMRKWPLNRINEQKVTSQCSK